MTRIESNIEKVAASQEKIFNFLSDLNNLGKLMPEQVTNWKCTGDDCSYDIKGMASVAMKTVERVPHSEIKIASQGKGPFSFSLSVLFVKVDDANCTAQIILEGDINPFMKVMVEKPLTNFINYLVRKLTHFETL